MRALIEMIRKHALQGVACPQYAKDQCREIAEITAPGAQLLNAEALRTRVLIEVRGGSVTAVYSNAPTGTDVIVRDWDNIEAGDDDPAEDRPEFDGLDDADFQVY